MSSDLIRNPIIAAKIRQQVKEDAERKSSYPKKKPRRKASAKKIAAITPFEEIDQRDDWSGVSLEEKPKRKSKALVELTDEAIIEAAHSLSTKKTKKKTRPEEAVQRAIVESLMNFGYLVEQTTVRIKLQRCPECYTRFRPKGGYGSTRGIADLLVCHPRWVDRYGDLMRGFWVQLEVKSTVGKLTPEQKIMKDTGHLYLVRSVDDCVVILDNIEKRMEAAFGLK